MAKFIFVTGGVMLRGKWVYEKYDFPGICIDAAGRVSTGWKEDAEWDYAAAGQAAYLGGRLNNKTAYSRNGVTYTGVKGDGSVVCLLASRDAGLTGEEAVAAMLGAGCVDILRWDGSWSSQGSLGPGMDVQPSQKRICRGWLLVFPRETREEPKTLYRVQVGAFSVKANAERLRDELKAKGYPGFIQEVEQ